MREIKTATRAEWLAERQKTIGSSDAPVILGVSPWGSRVRLYAEKLGQIKGMEDGPKLQMGRRMEPVILELAAEALDAAGHDVTEAALDGRYLVSDEHPWASATLDGRIVVDGADVIVELKNTDQWQSWTEGPPVPYWVQCQHQMLVTGATRMLLVVLIRGWDLRWCWVERDERHLAEVHVPECERFWRQVRDRELPDVDAKDDTRAALARLFPDSVPGVEIALGGEWIDLDRELMEAQGIADAAQGRVDQLKNQLRASIGDTAEAARIPGGVLWTWKGKNGRRQLRRYGAND